ncbi:MAG: trypsin-like peptidase domain-containing protein [Candidatus Dadabacteria bacterium]|nr:trypsin-like peptidase domain-containing protein [Candidatus Dadabacteria bacterium]MDE0663088.1 trypsin-like peptidase domain-containing protein [Candidatus Dadabacteria bacterium]
MGSTSCGGGDTDYTPPPVCDLTSQRNEQRLYLERAGERRDDYYPKRFSRNFKKNYSADISPTKKHEDIARKVSRSVLELEVRETNSQDLGVGSAWLIAPKYAVTAAHAFIDFQTLERKPTERVFIHTFDGDRIEAEVVYADPRVTRATDLALLRLEREIDATPLKIADRKPLRNEFLMAIGGGQWQKGIGGWTVSAGPALELKSGYPLRTDRMYHAVPTSGGMSGGPIFNEDGEVVSIVSAGSPLSEHTIRNAFGVMPSEVPEDPPERLWVYAFEQPHPYRYSAGPNIEQLKEFYEERIPDDEKPHNAGNYRNDNVWPTGHEFGDKYSPFPLDQFEHMDRTYKEARKATVTIGIRFNDAVAFGSGFIYDENTIVTAGHLGIKTGLKATITAYDNKEYEGTVSKRQFGGLGECDIAVIKMDKPGALSEYPELEIADSSSPKCGDPLVSIGSGDLYDNVGPLQGVGAVYMLTYDYMSEFLSHFTVPGMSGGPIVDRDGKVVSINSRTVGRAGEEGEWNDPGPLVIRNRLPVYIGQDYSEGPNAETIRKFVEEPGFFCPENRPSERNDIPPAVRALGPPQVF